VQLLSSVVSLAPMCGIDLSSAPNVQGWLQRCSERPALARAQARP